LAFGSAGTSYVGQCEPHACYGVLSNAVFNAGVVASLTWLVMPLITRALHRWLHSEQEGNVTK
jgi:antibiotic biosynthesis monooxygenase (ABM) superfamily enzyme